MQTFRAMFLVLIVAGLAAAGCDFTHDKSVKVLEPSAVIPSLLGSWTTQSITPTSGTGSQSCTNFKWNVTSQTATDIAGTFTAVCLGNATILGSATGQITGSTLSIIVTGSGSMPTVPNCPFNLSGSGPIVGDTIAMTYSGATCLGTLSGTVNLKKTDVFK